MRGNEGVFVLAIFLILFVPLVFSQECGDFICDVGEDATCPSDCTGEDIIVSDDDVVDSDNVSFDNVSDDVTFEPEEIAPAFEDTVPESDAMALENSDDGNNISDETVEVAFFSSWMFKIIIVLLVLIIIGVVVFIIYRKMGADNRVPVENLSGEGSS